MLLAVLAKLRGDRVALLVFSAKVLDCGLTDGVDVLDEIADGIVIGGVAETCLGAHLVAFCDGHITHIVGKAREFRTLPVIPGPRYAHPSADTLLHLSVRPMSDHHFAVETQSSVDESCFAVAMRRLIKIHEVHIN